MSVIRLQQKNYQLEDRVMEGYAVAYRASAERWVMHFGYFSSYRSLAC